jgi:hypothetical protein
MPNVTITVPDELKAEMDKLAEVSWSEICRNAISLYISQRSNPTPWFELSLERVTVEQSNFQTGYPTLTIDLKIHNKTSSELIVDRIIVSARGWKDSHAFPLGIGYGLNKTAIIPNSAVNRRIFLVLLREKIASLENVFTSSFNCEVHFSIYAEGFKNGYEQDLTAKIPIDEWKEVVIKTLQPSTVTRVPRVAR